MQAPLDALRAALAGRYEVERELGQGGMAAVFLARDLKHHRQVAVKIVRPDVAAALGADRFLREIETAASLTHPHILPVHDSGDAGGFLYYVMPYVEGESLRAKLDRETQLPLDEALRIAREVADALSYAHSHGIVHRDIKPANILLESGHAVVADFGIARAVAAAGAETPTETGVTVGTPAYMSPEQASGSKHLDGRSDLYSLGCVLYEMLAGQPPFTGPTAESLVHQHLSVAPRSVTELRPAVPGWVAVALQRALAKAPADRFNPVAQFAEALAHGGTDAQPTRVAPTSASSAAPVPGAPGARRRWAIAAGAVLIVAALGGALYLTRPRWGPAAPATTGHPRTAIAVLPFQNLSADGPHAYFAGGLHDELLTQLAKVASLKPISRTSVMGYQGTTKPLTQIADELHVGTIVEGSVQVVGGRLRVNVQLIDAATDQHIWADRYDRTLEDAFAIQSDLAQKIVTAVGAALSPKEQGHLAAAPTASAEAYQFYLQGREYFLRPGYLRQNFEVAQRLLERALALDPGFALAHAALSRVHGSMFWYRYDPSRHRPERQREEAEAALRLAPELPEAHFAIGEWHYRARRDWGRARDEYGIALEGRPNDAQTVAMVGYVHRRLGNWNEVLSALEKATELDPRDANLFFDLGGNTHDLVREYARAIRFYEQALSLAPDMRGAAVRRGWVLVRWQGSRDALRESLAGVPDEADLGALGSAAAQRAMLRLMARDADGLLANAMQVPNGVLDGRYVYAPPTLFCAWAHQLRRNDVESRRAFGAALVRLDLAMTDLSGDWRVHASRGLALAGLARRDEARREAAWLSQSAIYREDAFDGPYLAEERARILAQAGFADEALDEIERLLSGPSWLSVHTLRLDLRWDPIREHPRFKALLTKYATPGS